MRQLPTGEPVWDLQFNENGQLTAPAQGDFLNEVAGAGITDLFAFSHGWGTAPGSARGLYDQMFPMIRNAAHGLAGIGTSWFRRHLLAVAVVPPDPGDPSASRGGDRRQAGTPRRPSAPGPRRCPAPTSRRRSSPDSPTRRSRTRSRRSAG